MKIRKTLKYKLYRHRRNRYLVNQIDIAGIIWNHALALQKRYYRLTGKHIGLGQLKKHVAKLRRQATKYAYWQKLGSQAVQDVLERLEKSYQRFFAYKKGKGPKAGLPRFQKVKKYSSFTLKQAGWAYLGGNKVRLGGDNYKFVLSRPLEGEVKTVTIKRDKVGQLSICFSVIEEIEPVTVSTGKSGGFDFGLKTFLTDDEGRAYKSPHYLQANLKEIACLNRQLSRKKKGSHNREKAKRQLARAHERLANKRRDAHCKLALSLVREYDVIYLEDLNLRGMKALWGRKVSDLGFAGFVTILAHMAWLHGKQVVKVDRFAPTSQTCSRCLQRQKIGLRERTFICEHCGLVIDRDHNAAINIKRVGASTPGIGVCQSGVVPAVHP